MNIRFFRISKMQKILATLLAVLVMGFSLGAVDGAFTILSLNDTHSHLLPWYDSVKQREYGGAARWSTLIKEVKEEVGEVLVLHGGDFVQGSAHTYLIEHSPDWDRLPHYGYRGLLDVPVFNMIGLDAMCIGNHEFDYGLQWLMRLSSKAEFDILSANVELFPVPTTDEFAKANIKKTYSIFERNGISIAVIGMTTDEFNKSSQVRIQDPAESVRAAIQEIGNKASIFVVLSHLGHDPDIELARAVPEIDIIVGGHSHTTLQEPVYIGKTIITQAGGLGRFVGRMDVVVKNSRIVDSSYRLMPADFSVSEDEAVSKFVKNYLTIGNLPTLLKSDFHAQSSMGAYTSEALRKNINADYGLFSSKYAVGELHSGVVTAEDFFTVFWPYRMRDTGPGKDMTPKQILDILHGRTHRFARQLLNVTETLASVMCVTIPSSVMEEIYSFNETLIGTPEYLQISEIKSGRKKKTLDLAVDLQTYRFLYQERILDKDMPYKVYDYELFDVMFEAISGKKLP